MDDKLKLYALSFLHDNLGDPEVESDLAVFLGLAEDEEEYDGGKYEEICNLVEQALTRARGE